MLRHKLWPLLCALILAACCLGRASDLTTAPSTRQTPHDLRPQVGRSAIRSSSFANVPRAAGHSRCEVTRVPEPLATPDPLLEDLEIQKVTISFIVGTDGRVHSAFILHSGGFREDRAILETVRSWRYRPALCNGVPTEAEARIQFSSP